MTDDLEIRQLLMTLAKKSTCTNTRICSPEQLCSAAMRDLGVSPDDVDERLMVLSAFHDLYREGYFSLGSYLDPFEVGAMHVTQRGHAALEQLSRDPLNPPGYMAHLSSLVVNLDSIAKVYIEEALQTFAAQCHRATAVLVGAATERLVILLREAILEHADGLSSSRRSKIGSWKISVVLNAIRSWIDSEEVSFPKSLESQYRAYWVGIGQHIRMARNESGHPIKVDSADHGSVHASLLFVPHFVTLTYHMIGWLEGGGGGSHG